MSVFEETWNYQINLSEIEINSFHEFKLYINENCKEIFKIRDESFLLNTDYQSNSAQTYDDELKILVEKNKLLRQEMDCKLKKVSCQKSQYENYKQDQKLLTQEIKETHEAFLMAKKYYKKFLKIYYSIESRTDDKQVIYIQFFTDAKKDSENYSVRFIRNVKSKEYELISTIPKLKIVKEYQRILKDTNDLPGALYSMREEFMALKRTNKCQ